MKAAYQNPMNLIRRAAAMVLAIVLLLVVALPAQAAETNDVWEKRRHEWKRLDRKGTLWIEYHINRDMYWHYADLDRDYGLESLSTYVNDPYNREVVADIVKGCFGSIAESTGLNSNQIVREMVNFIQGQITYKTDLKTTDMEEYPRYPIETLYEGQGDCEDTSILLACMLREYGYGVALIHVPGHIAVGLKVDDNYNETAYYHTEYGKYVFIETTDTGWSIGEIPEKYANIGATFLWL